MRRPAPLPPHLGREFTVATAFGRGIAPGRLRRGDLSRPFRGARATSMPRDVQDRAAALAPLLATDQRFSHVTAAELWGMRLPERHPEQLHVTYRNGARAMRRPGVVGHVEATGGAHAQLTPSGLPASAPLDAWCECASLLTIDELIVMGDGLVSRRNPVATLARLADAVDARSGRRGTARLRIALQGVRANSDSARETMLRLAVMRAGFPEPEVNAPLRDKAGSIIAHGDLVWSEFRVVLEYEGRQHAEDPAQFAIDIRRLDRIAEAAYRVIRVDRQLMSARVQLFRTIATALVAGGWHPNDRTVACCRSARAVTAVGDASAARSGEVRQAAVRP